MIPGPFVPTVILRVTPDELVGLWPSPRRVPAWVVAYATLLELPRHGRVIAFVAGVLLTLLAQSALSELVTTGRGWTTAGTMPPTTAVASSVRAAHARQGLDDPGPTADEARAYSEPARTTSAIDELPASAPSASPRTMVAPLLRDDPALVARTSPVPRAIVVAAAERYGVDPALLLRVAACESGPHLDPNAIGDDGRALGVMQFHARTFLWLSRLSGLGYELRDVADVAAQADLAAWAFAHGYAALWTCAR